jgi:hypothetical protein
LLSSTWHIAEKYFVSSVRVMKINLEVSDRTMRRSYCFAVHCHAYIFTLNSHNLHCVHALRAHYRQPQGGGGN